MARNITTADVAGVSDAQITDALKWLTHYRLLKIVQNLCYSKSQYSDAFKKKLFTRESRVSPIDEPPGSTFHDYEDDSFDDTDISYDTDESEEEEASVDEKKGTATKKISSNKKKTQSNREGCGESALEKANPDGKNKAKVGSSLQATGTERLRKRYAACVKCKMEFDVCRNVKMSCRYHTKGFNRGYGYYACCKRLGDARGCTVDFHREKEYRPPQKRQKK